MRFGKIKAVAAGAGFAVLAAIAALAPAHAADAVFPTASRIGLVPPSGMVPSKNFPGFEDADKHAAIVMTALPAAAYAELEKNAILDVLKKEGVSVERREPIQLSVGKGFVVIGKKTTDNVRYRDWLLVAGADELTALVRVQIPERAAVYPDSVIRAALMTLAVRTTVPDEEQLKLVPFVVGDLAGFHIENVLPGRGLSLIDTTAGNLNARMLIGAVQAGPIGPDDRAKFARLAFDEISGIKDVHITMSEPLRIGGQPGFQTMANAKDTRTNTDIMVVQWLRFGSGALMQMVGVARADNWTELLTRLRTVRDSVEPK